jgi:hypothetical protein
MPTLATMALYSHFLGSKVTVQYRAGEILLTASGTFVGDSGRSIFLEQHLEQRGRRNYFRWEIPYPNIHHLEVEAQEGPPDPAQPDSPPVDGNTKSAAAAAGESAFGSGSILPLPQKRKTA